MRKFSLNQEQWLPQPIGVVFQFFASAENLAIITPRWLGFRLLTRPPFEIRSGTVIECRIRRFGLPLRWRTEIREWEPPYKFVDVQVKGPYQRWVHTHTFREHNGGTLCRDHVSYAVPGGALIERWFVRRQLRAIFAFRRDELARRFGTLAGPVPTPTKAGSD